MAQETAYIEIDGQQSNVRLVLDTIAHEREGGGEITAIITLSFVRPSKPFKDQEVLFYLNGEVRAHPRTNEHGVARESIVVPYGTHEVRAQVQGTGLSVREVKTFTEPPKPVATELAVYAAPQGPATRYDILIEVIGEKRGVPNWPLDILDPRHPEAAQRHQHKVTDLNGSCILIVETQTSRTISISAVGTKFAHVLTLEGPLPNTR